MNKDLYIEFLEGKIDSSEYIQESLKKTLDASTDQIISMSINNNTLKELQEQVEKLTADNDCQYRYGQELARIGAIRCKKITEQNTHVMDLEKQHDIDIAHICELEGKIKPLADMIFTQNKYIRGYKTTEIGLTAIINRKDLSIEKLINETKCLKSQSKEALNNSKEFSEKHCKYLDDQISELNSVITGLGLAIVKLTKDQTK